MSYINTASERLSVDRTVSVKRSRPWLSSLIGGVGLIALCAGEAAAQGLPSCVLGTQVANYSCSNAIDLGNPPAGQSAISTNGTLTLNNLSSGIIRSSVEAIIGRNGLTLNNAGQIISTGAGRDVIFAGGGVTSITNSGRIDSAVGSININVTGTSLTLNNTASGVITGGEVGIDTSAISSTITNAGTINGTNYGISSSGVLTLTNSGTITGGTSAVFLARNGNTINIQNGAVFTGGIDYTNTTGNTTNFYTGSYTLGVKNYDVANNTINLRGAGNQLITSGLNGAGTGNIVVVAPQVVTTPAAATNAITNGASSVVNAVLNSPVVPALSGFSPEAPAPGIGFQQASLALDPTFAERLQEAFPDAKLTNLTPTADLGVTRARQGQTVDAYGNLVWVRGFGATRNLPSTTTVVGNANTSVGMLFGYDRQVEDWRIGAYAGYAYGYTRMLDASGTLATDYYVGGLYGRRSFGPYSVTANLAGGLMGNRSSRSINTGAEQAIGAFSGFFIAPELALSYDMALGNGWTFTPTLRGRYVGAFLPGYSESGSSQNVTYGANSAHALEERLELKLTKAFRGEKGLASSIYVQAAALANQRIGSDSFNASLLGTDFTVTNPYARSTVGGLIGLGVEHQFDRQITGFAGADAALYSDSTLSFTGRAGVKVNF